MVEVHRAVAAAAVLNAGDDEEEERGSRVMPAATMAGDFNLFLRAFSLFLFFSRQQSPLRDQCLLQLPRVKSSRGDCLQR